MQRTVFWSISLFINLFGLTSFVWGNQEPSSELRVIDLHKAYRLAAARSETIQIQEEVINAQSEVLWQSKAVILPELSAGGSFFKRESIVDQKTLELSLVQPLFQGLGEIYGPKIQSAELEARQLELRQTKEDLYFEVAKAYYELLSRQKEKQHILNQLETINQRIKELEKRARIGRSRKSEVLSSQSQKALLEVELSQNEIELIESEQKFSLLIGASEFEIQSDEKWNPPRLISWEEVEKSIGNKTNLKVLSERLRKSDYEADLAVRGHLPTAQFETRYYFLRTGPFFNNSNWDVAVTVSVPLFSGGTAQSKIRQAAAQRKQAELALVRARRQEWSETKALYDQAKVTLKLLNSFQKAVELSDRNYQTQQKEYRLGLVTNLEVFEALNTSLETKRKRDVAFFQLKTAIAQLKVGLGKVDL